MSSYDVNSYIATTSTVPNAVSSSTKVKQYEPQVQLLCQRIKDEMLLAVRVLFILIN